MPFISSVKYLRNPKKEVINIPTGYLFAVYGYERRKDTVRSNRERTFYLNGIHEVRNRKSSD